MVIAIKRSVDALGALFICMVMAVIVFSSLVYFAERGE